MAQRHGPIRRFLRSDLVLLARLHGTDKWGTHQYALHYQKHFERLRNRRLNLLEIGVGGQENPKIGGHSLRMWKDYFPNANIYGLDIYDKSSLEEPRIRIFRGSQADTHLLKQIVSETGRLDIVIDDGSHINEHVITAFQTLFPLLADDGIYAIEDLGAHIGPIGGEAKTPAAKPPRSPCASG